MFKLSLAALLFFGLTSLSWGQSNASLTRLIETNLVAGSGLIYLIVPAPLNHTIGQGEYYLVFYVGIVSASPGVVSHVHGMLAVRQSNAVFNVVSTIPVRDSNTGNIIMTTPFIPDLARGDGNKIFYTRDDVEHWYKSFNMALQMLPSTLAEIQAVMGNNRDYQMSFLQPRNLNDLLLWDDFFEIEPPCPPVVGALNVAFLQVILFFVCVVFGVCLFDSFIDSFEKGSF
jgi:hypothetical protein